MRKIKSLIAMLLAVVFLAACTGPVAPEAPPEDAPAPAPATPAAPAVDEEEEEEEEEEEAPEASVDEDEEAFFGVPVYTPRNETLFTAGTQWGPPNNINPFSLNPNHGFLGIQGSGAEVLIHETLYMYNFLYGTIHPLLAAGEPEWNDDRTIITVPINPDARWSDGTQLTAHDVVASFDTHVRVGSLIGGETGDAFTQAVATDDFTVEFHLCTERYNPLGAMEFLVRGYIVQQAYIESLFDRYGDDYTTFRDSTFNDAPHSGPFTQIFYSSHRVVLQRNDDYWGQAPSRWGRLAEPRFVVHNIFVDNVAMRAALAAGEIDMMTGFVPAVWELWERDGLPISTYLDEPPFHLTGNFNLIHFNTEVPGLDQTVVRSAIAYAIDYDQITVAAMSNYTPTFQQVPRSIAAPVQGELNLVDFDALAHLQWEGADIERANRILDEAGIVDTDGDGIREWNGENMSFSLMCPIGFSDWEASLEIVASIGEQIGIHLYTTGMERAQWFDALPAGDFDIAMSWSLATSVGAPWTRARGLFDFEEGNPTFAAAHRMHNPEIIELVRRAGRESDEAILREVYTEISRFILEEKPFVVLAYRPSVTQIMNESVWTGFQEPGDGIPPSLVAGYGVATLYNLRLINP